MGKQSYNVTPPNKSTPIKRRVWALLGFSSCTGLSCVAPEGNNYDSDTDSEDNKMATVSSSLRRRQSQRSTKSSSSTFDKRTVEGAGEVEQLSSLTGSKRSTSRKSTRKKTSSTRAEPLELKPRHVVGLRNQGNTCYFNSAMQMAIHTPGLQHIIREAIGLSSFGMKLTQAFCGVLRAASESSLQDDSPLNKAASELLNVIFTNSMRFYKHNQQDMLELWRLLLNEMKDEELQIIPSSDHSVIDRKKLSAVDKIFGGHYMTVYVCDKCTLPYHVCEPFLDVSIPLIHGKDSKPLKGPRPKRRQKLCNHAEIVEYCKSMDKFVEVMEEQLTDQEPLKEGELLTVEQGLRCLTRMEQSTVMCNKCANDVYLGNNEATPDDMITPASKKLLIFNLPAILTISLQRFQFTERGSKKVSHHVVFEEKLNLSPFCSKWCKNGYGSACYDLYGVVEHRGSLAAGHYMAYVKVPYNCFNNARIERIRHWLQSDYIDPMDMNKRQRIVDFIKKRKKGNEFEKTVWESNQALEEVKWQWYHINDSHSKEVDFSRVQQAEAFVLFYERSSPPETKSIQPEIESSRQEVYV